MIGKKINKKLIQEEEDENDLIINNDDDFDAENELKVSPKKNLEIKIEYHSPKESEIHSTPKIETNESKSNEKVTNKNIFTPVPNAQNVNVNSKEITGEEKTIFSKITEDLYLDNKFYLQPKKIYFDISKAKEDNYNKLTIENYLFTCADRENSKNSRIISNFLERKAKEQNNKKIGSDPEKDDSENFVEIRGLYSDRKKEKGGKSSCRSPEQFLKQQKDLEERHKKYIDKLAKKYIEEEKNTIKQKPTINKQSEKIANMKKEGNKDIHLKLYEDYNLKKQREEKYKNDLILKENKNKKLYNEEVKQNINKLYRDYEKRKNNFKEKTVRQLNEIKNMSAVSLIEKKSNFIIYKKLINIYKNEITSMFNKNISDVFDITYSEYLLFIFKLGLVERNYNEQKREKKNINIITSNNLVKNFNDKINNVETECFNTNIKNKIIFSQNILKRNTFFKSRSSEKNKLDEESELNNIKNSWKIITKSKLFSKENNGNSRRLLLFILSVYGIYKGDLNDNFIKREFPFLLQDEDKSYLIEENLTKQIYKYFLMFRNMAINNITAKIKEKEKEKLQEKSYNLLKYKKEYLQNDSRYYVKTIDNNDKNSLRQNNKIFNISKSSRKLMFSNKFKNNLHKNQTNEIPNKHRDNIKNEMKMKESDNKITDNINNNEMGKIINNKNPNNLKKNLRPKKDYIINNKINLNKGISSISTKNIYKKNIIYNKNYYTNRHINYNNNKASIKNFQQKLSPNRKIISTKVNYNSQNQSKDSNTLLSSKAQKLSNNNVSNNQQERNIIEKINNNKPNNKFEEEKQKEKPSEENIKHQREKNSSISNYIFKEDYRIKEDIQSNSNLNNFEETENKKISSKNSIHSDLNVEKNQDFEINNNRMDNINNIEQNKILNKNKNNMERNQKNKFVFKIKIKKKLIKLIINKGDDLESKINAFCEENDLDEEDKEEILEAIKSNLNA